MVAMACLVAKQGRTIFPDFNVESLRAYLCSLGHQRGCGPGADHPTMAGSAALSALQHFLIAWRVLESDSQHPADVSAARHGRQAA